MGTTALVSHLHTRAAAACPLKTTSTITYITLLHLIHLHSLQLKNLKMASQQHPASESPFGEETTDVPMSDCPSTDDLGCLDTSSNNSTLDFCNIRGLRSNFQSMEHHLSSTKPHLGKRWYNGLAFGQANLGSRVRSPNICWPLFIVWYYRRVAKDYPNCCHTILRRNLQCL